MAQGLRGRWAMLGAGLLFTGIVGCMDNDPKPIKAPPKAQSSTGMMGSTVKPNQSTGFNTGTGIQQTGAQQMAPRNNSPVNNNFGSTPAGGSGFGSPAGGTIGSPTVPGNYGAGASMAPSSAYGSHVPPTSPNGYKGDSGYPGSAGGSGYTPGATYNPGLGSTSSMPPAGFDQPLPPVAPSQAPGTAGYPMAPSPYGK